MKYSPNSLHYHDQQKSTYLCGSSSGQDLLKLCVHLCVWRVSHPEQSRRGADPEQQKHTATLTPFGNKCAKP